MLEKNFKKEFTLFKNLKNIKGISNSSANFICKKLGVSSFIIYKDLSKKKINKLSSILTSLKRNSSLENNDSLIPSSHSRNPKKWNLIIDRNLSLTFKENINKLIQLNTHRGRRIKYGYPAHGQRTSSNAKTAKKTKKLFKW